MATSTTAPLTVEDIEQIIEAIDHFVIGGNYELEPLWQRYIDKLRARIYVLAAAADLLDALKALLKDIDTGMLVRDISRDSAPGWTQQMLAFVQRLQAAQRAVLKAEDGR